MPAASRSDGNDGRGTDEDLARLLGAIATVAVVALAGWLRDEDRRVFVVEVRERSGARLHIEPADGILRSYEEPGVYLRAVVAVAPRNEGGPWRNATLDIGAPEYAPWLCSQPGEEGPGARCTTYEGPRLFIEQSEIEDGVHLFGLGEPIGIGIDGADAFSQPIDGLEDQGGRFTVVVGNTLFGAQVFGDGAPIREELLPVLRSLAEQLC